MSPHATPIRKDRIDATGAALLIFVSALFGINQVLVKLVNAGMNPVFQAGLRSAVAILPVLAWALWRRSRLSVTDGSLIPGILCGLFFAFEFYMLFRALEYTTVGHSSVMFYTMPVWLALFAHFLIPGERMTRRRAAGLALAVLGIVIALLPRGGEAGDMAIWGDLMALVATLGWTAIALTARLSKLSRATPEMQLLYQVVVSAPILLVLAAFHGAPFREMTPALWSIFAFQVLGIVTFAFMLWFWILKVYPASDMASFAFLTPLFGVFFGWAFLGEQLTVNVVIALVLVAIGIWLVNSRPKPRPVSGA
jgi:drug/metabolite transporter (DMT)-like permease